MPTEIVWLGHDNSIDLILKAAEAGDALAAVDLSTVTRMTLTLGTLLVDSDNGATDPIRWYKAGYNTGEVRLFLDALAVAPGKYDAPLIVYDAVYIQGVVWGYVVIVVKADPEGATP